MGNHAAMNIITSRFGEIEVPDDSLIAFPEGIVGFKDAKGFVIFDCGDQGVFKWLQSTTVPELAFVICEASLVLSDYQIMISPKDQETLQLKSASDAAICLILVIPEDPQETTANLLGPIVMNSASRIGMQLVVVNPEYSTRHKVFKPARSAAPTGKGADHARAQ